MSKKKKPRKTLDEYIQLAKDEIWFYLIIYGALFLGILYYGYKMEQPIFIFFATMPILFELSRIETYYNLKKIKSYLINYELGNKIGGLDYWNEKSYFLAENYMIIIKGSHIYSFKYESITKMYKEVKYSNGAGGINIEEILHIYTKNNTFKVLMSSLYATNMDCKDIRKYLLDKNPNIEVLEDKLNRKAKIFKIKWR